MAVGLTALACSDRAADGWLETTGVVHLASSSCDGSSIVIDAQAAMGFTRIESAIGCLGRRRLVADVDVLVRSGVYEPFLNVGSSPKQTAALVIDHPDAAHITLRGEPRLDVPLSAFNSRWPVYHRDQPGDAEVISHYGFKYNLDHADWLDVVSRLQALPVGGEAYALIRRTRKLAENDGLNHAVHQGIWQVDIPATLATADRLIVHLKYRPQDPSAQGEPRGLAELPSPLDAEFGSEVPPIVSILTSVLKFTCSPGVVIDASQLKGMQDIVVVGDYDAAKRPAQCIAEKRRRGATGRVWSQNFPGISVWRGGGIDLSYVGVSSMDGQGVSVQQNSWAVATRVAASGNERRGFYPTFTAAALFSETIASGNHKDGYIADHSAFTEVDRAWAIGNTEHGYNTIFGAQVHIDESTSASNGLTGFASKGSGTFWFEAGSTSSDAFRNHYVGLSAEIGGDVRVRSLKLDGNDAEGANVGIKLEMGVRYSADSSVDNRDGSDFDEAEIVTDMPEPQPRSFFTNRQPYAPLRTDLLFEESQVVIDPGLQAGSSGARSIHDFFNVPGPYSIAGKRISLPDAPPAQNYVTLELGAGVFPYTGRPIVIGHPDARRVKIRGQSCPLRVRSTMAPLNDCGPSCKEVKLELSGNDCAAPIQVGDFIAIPNSDYESEQYHPHWVHRGVWQVSAVNVNGNPNRLKVRNFGGEATIGASLLAPTGAGSYARLMRTVLYFPDATGGIVVDGTTLGALEHLVLVGSELPLLVTGPAWLELASRSVEVPSVPNLDSQRCLDQGYEPAEAVINEKSGLKIQNCGHAYYDMVAVTGFPHAGVRVANNSSLVPWPFTDGYLSGSLLATANGTHGMVAINDGGIWAKFSVANANGASGYYATNGGAFYVSHSSAAANAGHGFEVRNDGYVEANTSAAIRNGTDGVFVSAARFTAGTGNAPTELEVATILGENGAYGCRLQNGSYAALNGAWSLGHSASNRAGIHVSDGSKCRCRALTLLDNDFPIKAMSGSLVSAPSSECEGNAYEWFAELSSGAQIVGTCQ